MELDLQPGDVVKVLESAALGWVRARVIRVKSGGRVVVQSDQGRELTVTLLNKGDLGITPKISKPNALRDGTIFSFISLI